jgi:hypothetical protein
MTGWEYLRKLNSVCQFHSRERTGVATNSELKRWLQNQSIQLNGRRIKWNEEVDFPVEQLILFPKRNRVTIF